MAIDVNTAANKPGDVPVIQSSGSISSSTGSDVVREHVYTKDEKNEAYVEVDADLDEDAADVKELPPAIRRIVSLTDDPSLPTLTFRYWVLSTLFVVPGAFLSQISTYRTTYAPCTPAHVALLSPG